MQSAAWLPSGDVIVTCCQTGCVRFWSFSPAQPGFSGAPLGTIDAFGGRSRGDARVNVMALSPSRPTTGTLFACCGGNGFGNKDSEEAFVRVFRAPEQPRRTAMQGQLAELFRSRRGADVTLVCTADGRAVAETPAHSLVLSLRSSTLQRQLEWGAGSAAAASSELRRLEIDPAVEPPILEKLLEFMCVSYSPLPRST